MTVSLSDLMKELQAGEEARAQVPSLAARISELTNSLNRAQAHNSDLEVNIIGYKQQIDGLTLRIRSLEVERDDAGFRELETQDKLNTLLSAMRSCEQSLGEAADGVHPEGSLVGAIVARRLGEAFSQQSVQPTSVPVNTTITEGGTSVGASPHYGAHWDNTEEPGVVSVSPNALGERVTDPTVTSANTTQPNASFEPVSTPGDAAAGKSGESAFPPPSALSTAPIPSFASGDAVEQSPPAPSTKTEEYRPFEGQSSGEDAIKPNAGQPWYRKPSTMSTADWVASGGQP